MKFWKKEYNYKIIDDTVSEKELQEFLRKNYIHMDIVDKQFISYYGGTGYKISNEECGFWLWHNKNESQKVCDKLNSILYENEQLKKENYELHKRLGDFEPFEEHMKERISKTSVNYIVGLVKTDESTDIVELKRG